MLAFFMSTGFIEMLKAGGARDENFVNAIQESSPVYVAIQFLGLAVIAFSVGLFFLKSKRVYTGAGKVFILLVIITAPSLWNAHYFYPLFKDLVFYTFSLLGLYGFVSYVGYIQAYRFLEFVLRALLSISLFVIVFFPDYGVSVGMHEGSWQGIFGHKNALGNFLSFAFIVFFFELYKRRTLGNFFFVSLALLMLIMAGSNTALLISVLASFLLLVYLVVGNIKGLYLRVVFAFILVFPVLMYALSQQLFLDAVGLGDVVNSIDFSNRDKIWSFFAGMSMEYPFIGHGHNQLASRIINSSGFIDGLSGQLAASAVVGSTHSGFIDTFYSYGVLGLVAVYWAFFLFVRIGFSWGRICGIFSLLILASFVITNTFEDRMIGFNFHFLSVMYMYFILRSGDPVNA